MHETFDTRLEFDEGTVRKHVDDFAVLNRADRVLLFDVIPRVGEQLFETQSDFHFLAIDVQDHHFDFLIHLHHLGWLRDTCVRHIGDVQKTVDSAEVNKRTEVRDVLDNTFANLTFFEVGHKFLLSVSTLFFDQRTTADNDVLANVINLQDFTLNDAIDVITDVAWTADVHLAGREEN